MGVWRQTLFVREEIGGTYAVEHHRLEDAAPEFVAGLTANQVVELLLTPPELKNIWWRNASDQELNDAPAPIRERMETKSRRFYRGLKCSECGDSGIVNGAPCPKCQAR